jgi:ABC-type Fe3+-siderophore transport system permease subunit
MSGERRGGGGIGAAFVLLVFVGAVAKFWVYIVAALGALVLFGLLLWLAFRAARRVDAEHQAQAALVARADQQHVWTLAGDDRGV